MIAILISSGCKNAGKTKAENSGSKEKSETTKNCFSKIEKEKALETILGTNDFQMFLHPEVEGRLPVKMVVNEFVTPDLKITSHERPVVFKDSLILPYGDILRLRITEMDCTKMVFSYSIFYPMEGAVLTGTAKKVKSEWEVQDTNWGIKD